MEKKLKHRKTGEIAYYKDGILKSDGCAVEIGVEPSKEFWEDITKDYEVLSFTNPDNKSVYRERNGVYKIYGMNGYSDIGSRNLEYCLNYYNINSVRRLSDGEVFSIGDKHKFFKHDVFKIEQIVMVFGDSIQLVSGSSWIPLEAAIKATPLFTTTDGVDIFKYDTYYVLQKNKFGFTLQILKLTADGPKLYYDSDCKRFSSMEAAEKFLEEEGLMDKKCLSLNDLLSVWGSTEEVEFYKTSPLFNNFKKLVYEKK